MEKLCEKIPMRIMWKKNKIRGCDKSDIVEIDIFIELIAANPIYAKYSGYDSFWEENLFKREIIIDSLQHRRLLRICVERSCDFNQSL